ncbi:MAG: hypothetical protein WC859_10105 [Elusimicrobiota bacterium]|jgi:hypothetical protein
MAFAVPSFEAGELTHGGLLVPMFVGGELTHGGMLIPSFVTGALTPANDLQIPSFVSGDYRDEFNVAVATFGSTAEAQQSLFPAVDSSTSTTASTLVQWGAGGVAASGVMITGAVVGGTITWVTAASSAAFVTTGASPTIFWEVVSSSATITGGVADQRAIDATVTGTAIVNGVVVGSASYHVSAASAAQIIDGVQFVQDFWDGWAFNLNTGAPSFYEGFKFNSFARVGSNYYGCSDTGIYLLGGDLDAAAEIDATVTTGYSDLSTEKFDGGQIKHVTTAYLDARSVSPMTITCRTEGQEYTYTFDTDRINMASARAEIGKGLKGTLWQFELKNVAGADFEATSLTVLVDPTKRRA